MNTLDKYLVLIDFLQSVDFSIDGDTLLFHSKESQIKETFEKLDLEGEFYSFFSKKSKDKFLLIDDNFLAEFRIYPSAKDFFSNISSYKKSHNFIVYSNQKDDFYGYFDRETYINKEKKIDSYFFKNIFSYISFIRKWEELGKKANASNESFRFIDYYNKENQTFLLTSLDKRALISKCTVFDSVDKDLTENLELFTKSLNDESKGQFPFFLKKEILEEAAKYDSDILLRQIFFNFKNLYNKALLNFQVYLNDISIDKLKGEYDDFKREYLSSFSEVISKILIKIISIPLAFGASVFAISKIGDDDYLIIVLILGLLASSIIINISLKNHFLDLKSISRILMNKTFNIRNHNFFKNNEEEKNELKEIIQHIRSKIDLVVRYIWSYFIFSSLFLIAIMAYPLKQLLSTFSFDAESDLTLLGLREWLIVFSLVLFIGHIIYMLFFQLWPKGKEVARIKKKIILD